jgi:hypothetical protein
MFLNFPRAPQVLLEDPDRDFLLLMDDIRCFLFHLASGYISLRDTAIARKYPPCAAELKFAFKLASPTLQTSLFISVLRYVEPDEAWIPEAVRLFRQDMADPAGSAISISELNAYHGAQLKDIVTRWLSAFRKQHQQFTSSNRGPSHILPSQQLDGTNRTPVSAQVDPSGAHNRASALPFESHARTSPSMSNSPSSHQTPPHVFQQQMPVNARPLGRDPLRRQKQQHPVQGTHHQPGLRHGHGAQAARIHGTLPHSPFATVHQVNPDPQMNGFPPTNAADVFHSPAANSPIAPPTGPPFMPIQQPGSSRPKQVQAIVGERVRNGRTEYRIRWFNHDANSDSWEPEQFATSIPHLLSAFRQAQATAASQPRSTVMHSIQATPSSVPAPGLTSQSPMAVNTAGGARIIQYRPGTREQPLFPADRNFVLPTYSNPNADRIALHQVGLRSPEYHKKDDLDNEIPDVRFYQYVEDVIRVPELITKDSDLIRWQVKLSDVLWRNRTISLPPVGEFLTRQRNVKSGDVQFRLKSLAITTPTRLALSTVSQICMQPTKWPKCLSISVNEHHGLDFRRKVHYGVDIACDVTEYLKEDENDIVIGALFSPEEAHWRFLMVLEIIRIVDHARLLQMPTRLPSAESLASITRTLKNSTDSDDDLIIEQPVISIDVVDPFMSRIWVTPVRGKLCLHRECFDLEAFLLSRTNTGPGKEHSMSSPDKWACPICKNDCRPTMLVLDEFLLKVRQTLEERKQLDDTKAIFVREDGSWEPKLELGSNEDDQGNSEPDTAETFIQAPPLPLPGVAARQPGLPATRMNSRTAQQASSGPQNVIVLDDDDD